MRLSIYAGPATTGKTSVIRHVLRKVKGAGGEECVVFSEAVPGDERGHRLPVLEPRAVRHRVDHVERGLRELRQPQLPAGIIQAELADGIAEHRVRDGGPVGTSIE